MNNFNNKLNNIPKPFSNNNIGGMNNPTNVGGIKNIPTFDYESRFSNVKRDDSRARQIMNNQGQNIIHNQARNIGGKND